MINASRLKLHEELVGILTTNHVYFQPPPSIKMVYPAIVYTRLDIDNKYAGNKIYNQSIVYRVTVLDKDPDSEVVERLSKLEYAVYDRHDHLNGINHDQFTVFYRKQ